MQKSDFKHLSLIELENFLKQNSYPAFRAKQIFDWVYSKQQTSFDKMANLPVELRARLVSGFVLQALKIKKQVKSVDGTQKFLFELSDGELIETVVIPFSDRQTICVSTQAGCKFACQFCASGLKGWRRNLHSGEIVEQVWLMKQLMKQPVTHVVFMGIGEPLDNYDEVIKAVRLINAKEGLNIAARRITISTCGVVPGILKMAEEGLQIELAVSLHASNDKLRTQFMPVNQKYPLAKLISACQNYVARTNRQVTFEYIMIKEVTSTEASAQELGRLLKGLLCKLNLIMYNPVPEFPFVAASAKDVTQFQRWLKNEGIHSTVRTSRGMDVSAACGQLRYKSLMEKGGA